MQYGCGQASFVYLRILGKGQSTGSFLEGHWQVFRGQHDPSSSGFITRNCSSGHTGSTGQLQPEIKHVI